MKKLLHFLVGSFLIFTGLSCGKECDCVGTGQFEYMVFGHFYGQCGGGEDCIEIYKLTELFLYEDSTDVYPGSLYPYAGIYTLLPDEKFQQVKDLIEAFPAELYEETTNIIGMPDVADQGGLYIEMKYSNEEAMSGYWLLDQYKHNLPVAYHDFIDKVNEKIALINQ